MTHSFVVGKYTLESLTNGMYASPMDLYREYIQNAVDSIDEAVRAGVMEKVAARIDISIDTTTSTIKVRDNGCGIGIADAARLLIDIGNSKKSRANSRGFRGIGRLAGLGYCDFLSFSTSAAGEAHKSVISFDAKRLKQLLVPDTNADDSIYDVVDMVVSQQILPEKANTHYFEVIMSGVSIQSEIMSYDVLKDYLTQNIPLPFHPNFCWGRTILSKIEISGYKVPEYNVFLQYNDRIEQLYKPYRDTIVSDRVKKLDDNIRDIQLKVLGPEESPLAVLWYASTNFYGTIIDRNIKGLRIRQGNILIGNSTTCAQLFKEERFNGWVIGEIHVLHNGLIANSRRDNFEQNEHYFALAEEIRKCAATITKELRRLSYDRTLSSGKKAVAEMVLADDVNALTVENLDYACEADEFTLMYRGDGVLEAEADFANVFSALLTQKKRQTKYTAININDKLTIEQRRILERVFDVISSEYSAEEAKKFIDTVIRAF